jgi:hypothetical protein
MTVIEKLFYLGIVLIILGAVVFGTWAVGGFDEWAPPPRIQKIPMVRHGDALHLDVSAMHHPRAQNWSDWWARVWDPCTGQPPYTQLLEIPGVRRVQVAPETMVLKHPGASWDDLEPQIAAVFQRRGC